MLATPRGLLSTFAAPRLALFAIGAFAVSRMSINAVEGQGFHLSPQPDTFLVLEAVIMAAFATWNCVA